nr:MAG TPA: hypothetical protein [Bacteriophage sp.]
MISIFLFVKIQLFLFKTNTMNFIQSPSSKTNL